MPHTKRRQVFGRLLAVAFCFAVSLPSVVNARDMTSVSVKKSGMKQTTIVRNAIGTAELRVHAESFTKKTALEVQLHRVQHPKRYPIGEQKLLSQLYRYDIEASASAVLQKELQLMLAYSAEGAASQKVIKYWNVKEARWKRLYTRDDASALQAHARLKRTHAVIAVFERPQQATAGVIEGVASWYRWHGAASNDFPIGSRIRVTNVHTGAFVDSTVVTIGPFVPGRVVDLPDGDFSHIAPLSAGVVAVTVQLAPQ